MPETAGAGCGDSATQGLCNDPSSHEKEARWARSKRDGVRDSRDVRRSLAWRRSWSRRHCFTHSATPGRWTGIAVSWASTKCRPPSTSSRSSGANVPLSTYDYTAHGTDSEFTLRRNRDAFDWVELVGQGGVAPQDVDTSTELFGSPMKSPIMLAPTSRQRDLHPDGELGMYRAATTTDTTMIVSNASSFPFPRIAEAAEGPLWYQLYARRDIETNRQPLAEGQEVGAQTVVVTVDQQASYYDRTLHDRNLGGVVRSTPNRRRETGNPYGVGEGRLWYEWRLFDDLRPMIDVPMLAKGILTGEGAKLCLEHGVEGIIVSNHGGRAIDYGPSTLEVLEEVVDAVGGRVPVLIDSGFRRGQRRALGARPRR